MNAWDPTTWSTDQWEALFRGLIGLGLLLFGRKLYWFFVFSIGFILGGLLVSWLLPDQLAAWVRLGVPLVCGIIVAYIGVTLQKWAIRFAGLVAGAWLAYQLAQPFLEDYGPWLCALAGALLGYFSILGLFDWALVLASTMVGAHLIKEAVEPGLALSGPVQWGVFFVLMIVGLAFQSRGMPGAGEGKASKKESK